MEPKEAVVDTATDTVIDMAITTVTAQTTIIAPMKIGGGKWLVAK